MKYCSKCGKELIDEAIVCPGCGCAVVKPEATPEVNLEGDKVNVGLCVVSALIPLVGLIYWIVKHKEAPKAAKACGITALISWGISIILGGALFSNILSSLYWYL